MNAPQQTRWSIVALCTLAGMVTSMQIGKVAPALGLLRIEFDLSLVQAGRVISFLAATAATVGILVGGISDRLGNRRTIAYCMGFIVVGNLLGAFAQSGNTLLFSRFIESIGFVGVVVSVPGILIRAATAADQRLAFGFWGSYMPSGMAFMMAVAPLFLAPVGWRGLWLANALAVLLFAIVFHMLTRDLAPAVQKQARAPLRASIALVLARPGPWLLGLCFMTYATQWIGLMAWLPTFLTETMNFSIADAALMAALVVGINVPGNWFGGWLLQRGVKRWYLPAFACAAMGLCGLGIFSADVPDVGRIGLALFFSFIAGLAPPTLLGGAPMHSPSPDLMGTTNGVIVNCANIGSFLGPPAFGAIVALTGHWQASGYLMAAAGSAGLIFAVLLGLVERRLTVPEISA